MDARDDRELLESAQAGDLSALGILFERHHQAVHALCYRLTGNAAAADDLTQESFLRILRYKGRFDGRAKFTTWLYRLVRNRCLDHMAGERRDRKRLELFAADVSTTGHTPEREDERAGLVRDALSRLPPEKREVLVLSRFEDLGYRDIAVICDISVENVKVRAHRAIRELRRIYQELEREA
ncbi:MAG TPA: RNA polymerase sigma factor [Gemmatimonadales bacterium]